MPPKGVTCSDTAGGGPPPLQGPRIASLAAPHPAPHHIFLDSSPSLFLSLSLSI